MACFIRKSLHEIQYVYNNISLIYYIINILNFCKDKKYYYVIVYQIFI